MFSRRVTGVIAIFAMISLAAMANEANQIVPETEFEESSHLQVEEPSWNTNGDEEEVYKAIDDKISKAILAARNSHDEDGPEELVESGVQATPPTTTPTMAPTPKKAPYIGCYKDKKARDLPVKKKNVDSVKKCEAQCAKYEFFGRQYTGECYCGNKYGKYGKATKCHCDAANIGGWKNCVYSNPSYKPPPIPTPVLSSSTTPFADLTPKAAKIEKKMEMKKLIAQAKAKQVKEGLRKEAPTNIVKDLMNPKNHSEIDGELKRAYPVGVKKTPKPPCKPPFDWRDSSVEADGTYDLGCGRRRIGAGFGRRRRRRTPAPTATPTSHPTGAGSGSGAAPLGLYEAYRKIASDAYKNAMALEGHIFKPKN